VVGPALEGLGAVDVFVFVFGFVAIFIVVALSDLAVCAAGAALSVAGALGQHWRANRRGYDRPRRRRLARGVERVRGVRVLCGLVYRGVLRTIGTVVVWDSERWCGPSVSGEEVRERVRTDPRHILRVHRGRWRRQQQRPGILLRGERRRVRMCGERGERGIARVDGGGCGAHIRVFAHAWSGLGWPRGRDASRGHQ
jgi:hypothetical protein